MDENITELSDALRASLAALTPCQLADELGIHNAHVYRARKCDFSPTLVAAMRRDGMIPPRPPYPYFKIRRDDPKTAAKQIIDNLGLDYSYRLANKLLRLQTAELKRRALFRDELGAKNKKLVILRDRSEIEIDEDQYISMEDRGWDW